MHRQLITLALFVLALSFVSAAAVTGKVVGPDGKPVQGAMVWLYLFDEQKPRDLLCNTAGGFAVDIDLTERQGNAVLANGIAYAPGYTPASVMLRASGNVITLNTASTLSGSVVNAEGKPLAGIPVRVLSVSGNENTMYTSVPDEWRARFTTASAADGSWTLPGIPLVGKVTVALADDRYVQERQTITLNAGAKAAPVQFIPRPGATAAGRVLAPDGTPAAHARVSIYAPTDPTAPGNNGVTAADGSYRFTGLSTNKYTIGAYSMEQAWVADPLTDITLTEGKETAIPDLHTQVGAALEGTVLDADTGTPIPHVQIMLYRGNKVSDDSRFMGLHADKSGHFLYRTKPMQLALLCQYPGVNYLKQRDTEAQTVELQEGKTAGVTIKLHKGLSVTGTVMDENGKPAAGVNCWINMPSNANGQWSRNDAQVSFTTDERGQFEAGGLTAGKGTFNLANEYGKVNEWELPAPVAIEVPSKEPSASG